MDDDDRPPWRNLSFDEEATLGAVLDLMAIALLAAVVVLLVAGGLTAAIRPDVRGFGGEWRQRVAALTQGVTVTTAVMVAGASVLSAVSARVHGGIDRRRAERLVRGAGGLAAVMMVLAALSAVALLSQTRFRPPLGFRIFSLGTTAAEIVLLGAAAALSLAASRR